MNLNDLSRARGSNVQIGPDDLIRRYEAGGLPRDFPRRLERLREASGLTWAGFARAVGVDVKQMHRWRRGAQPSGDSYHRLVSFAFRVPGGPEILFGEDYQMSFFEE